MDDNCDFPVEGECAACRATQEEVTAFIQSRYDATAEEAWNYYMELVEPHNWVNDQGFAEWLDNYRTRTRLPGDGR